MLVIAIQLVITILVHVGDHNIRDISIIIHFGGRKDSKQQGAPTPQHVQAKALVPEERREAVS